MKEFRSRYNEALRAEPSPAALKQQSVRKLDDAVVESQGTSSGVEGRSEEECGHEVARNNDEACHTPEVLSDSDMDDWGTPSTPSAGNSTSNATPEITASMPPELLPAGGNASDGLMDLM